MAYQQEDGAEDYVIRVRGLPWSCTEQQLRDFFTQNGQKVDKILVAHFTYNREGRPSGEAYLKFSDAESYEDALAMDKQYLNKRYVEVFSSKQAEMDYVVKHSGKSTGFGDENDDAVVRMRGLPYGCTKEEIATFFLGLEIAPNGIVMLSDPGTGRATGEAFVQFTTKDIAEKALQKHMQKIGHRYIEVFRSSAEERRRFLRRTTVGGSSGAAGFGGGARMDPGYTDWPAAAYQAPYYAGYGSPMGDAMSRMYDPAYAYGGATSDVMYAGRSSRPTPYDRPQDRSYGSARGSRPTSLVTLTMGSYPSKGYNGGGKMAAAGSSYKGGYQEGGYGGLGGRAGHIGTGPGHFVRMRGLPYSATEKEIIEFFNPLRIAGVDVVFDGSGRPSGEANVEFYTHADAVEAMKRDREMIGHRYVELFLNSSNTTPQSFYTGYRDFAEDHL